MKTVRAYYFSNKEKRLRHGDGRKIRKGVTHTFQGEPRLCCQGLHGSIKPLNALRYAPGPIIWKVELSGEMDIGDDKISAQNRKYIEGIDGTELLRKFARMCALDVVDKIKPYTSEADYDLIVKYLKTGNEDLRSAARSAAWSAAWSAAESAAESAARSAARDKQNTRLKRMIDNAMRAKS